MSQLCKTTQSHAPGGDHTRYNETRELTHSWAHSVTNNNNNGPL